MTIVSMELPTLPAGTTVVPSGIGIGGRPPPVERGHSTGTASFRNHGVQRI